MIRLTRNGPGDYVYRCGSRLYTIRSLAGIDTTWQIRTPEGAYRNFDTLTECREDIMDIEDLWPEDAQ